MPATRDMGAGGRRPALHVVMGPDGQLHVGQGGRLRVRVISADYAALVVDDLCLVDDLPGGAETLHDCDGIAHTIVIAPPPAPTEPPNGYVQPDDREAATKAGRATGVSTPSGAPGTGTGTGSMIRYDPAEWPWEGDPGSPPGHRVLLSLLRQAIVNARGADDPTDGRACLSAEGGS